MDLLVVFGESNLHVKKILGGSAHIFPILTNSSDLSHKRAWKILGMVLVKGLKKRLGVRVVLRFDLNKTRGLSPRFVRVFKAEEKKGTQSRKGAKVQREDGKAGERKGTQGREGAKVQSEDSRTVG